MSSADSVRTDRRLFRRLHVADPRLVELRAWSLEGATSYWASVVANPPGHMSVFGASKRRLAWLLPASRPARSAYDASNQASSGVQG